MRRRPSAPRRRRDPARDRAGSVAVMVALLVVPLLAAAGVAVDLGRVFLAVRTVQGVVDAAAMAGATVFTDASEQALAAGTAQTSFANSTTTLPPYVTVGAPSIAAAVAPACGAAGAVNTVTVAATATISTTLMHAVLPAVTVTVTATGAMPQVQISLDVSGAAFSPQAGDHDTVYWYKVPANQNPAEADLEAALQYVTDNMSMTAATTFTACINPTQKIGFALSEIPSGKIDFYESMAGTNQNAYGGTIGNTYSYYSTLFPPSADAYPAWPNDSALQIVAVNADGSYAAPSAGIDADLAATPNTDYGYFPADAEPLTPVAAQGSVSCANLGGAKIHIYWNDMGLSWNDEHWGDDFNYTDAEITFGCSSSQNKVPYLMK